jgi:hypothetical protein
MANALRCLQKQGGALSSVFMVSSWSSRVTSDRRPCYRSRHRLSLRRKPREPHYKEKSMLRRSFALFAALCSLTLLAAAASLAQEVMSVLVKEAEVRQSPSFLSPIVGKLPYGVQVQILAQNNGWFNVTAQGLSGFVHESALSSQTAQLQPGKALAPGASGHEMALVGKEVRVPQDRLIDEPAKTGASSKEVALAGKGFSQQIEGEYRRAHPNANFAWIDQMESYTVSSEQMRAFVQEGGLTPGGK